MRRIHYLYIGLVFLLSVAFTSVVSAQNESIVAASCGSAEIIINELDYAQPGSDLYEFVELLGAANTSLAGYELHFINNTSPQPYEIISLADASLSGSGYLVVANNMVSIPSSANKITKSESNFIQDGTAGAIGLYDTSQGSYCLAINYGGTVSGFEAWLNIGEDSSADGADRGCRRSDSGWWSCNRSTTPGGSNAVVAVEGVAVHASTPQPATVMGGIVLSAIGLIMMTGWFGRKTT